MQWTALVFNIYIIVKLFLGANFTKQSAKAKQKL